MPQNGWTRVEEPTGWTLVEPAKPAEKLSVTDAAMMDNPSMPAPMRAVSGLLRVAKRNPVATGATVGSALATGGASIPAELMLAALGAAGGSGYGMLAKGKMTGDYGTPEGNAQTMATEGGAAAAGQGIGTGVAKIAGRIAQPVAKAVLRASPTLQREFPNLTDTFLAERIPVGQSAEAGVRIKNSAATARQMATDAEAAGAPPVGARDIVKEFRPVRDEIANRAANARPGAAGEMQELVTRAKGLKIAGPQSVGRNQVLKQSAQTDANNAFRAAERGTPINDVTAKLDKAVAVGRQKAAETRVPGIADQNKQTQNLMGLETALENAGMKSGSPLGFNPVNWGAAMAPGTSSRFAFGLDSASRAPLGGVFRNALLAALGALEEDPNRPR